MIMSIFSFEIDIPDCLSKAEAEQVLEAYKLNKNADEATEVLRELVRPYLEEEYERLFAEIQSGLEDETSELLWNYGIDADLEAYEEEEVNI
jgi:hypothetical protein